MPPCDLLTNLTWSKDIRKQHTSWSSVGTPEMCETCASGSSMQSWKLVDVARPLTRQPRQPGAPLSATCSTRGIPTFGGLWDIWSFLNLHPVKRIQLDRDQCCQWFSTCCGLMMFGVLFFPRAVCLFLAFFFWRFMCICTYSHVKPPGLQVLFWDFSPWRCLFTMP